MRSRRTLTPKVLICAACFESKGIRPIEAQIHLDDHGTTGRILLHAEFGDGHLSGANFHNDLTTYAYEL